MTCFQPLQAVRIDSSENPIRIVSGVQALQLRGKPGYLQLPCGKCVGCRLAYSKGWAVRNCHEAQVCDIDGLPSTFVTLTYNDEFNARNGGALNYRDCQLFLKRLRFAISENFNDYAFSSNPDLPLRFYMCGEYGTRTFRPHYHFLFYNLGFYDERLYKSTPTGHKLFNSDTINSFWTDVESGRSMGHVVTGSVTVQSAGYVARYCVKKALQGKSVHLFNHDTGEFMPDEFTQMSRRPGIAYEWFKRYGNGVYPSDKVVLGNGMFYKPPRYYDNQLEKADPLLFEQVKQARLEFSTSPQSIADNSIERLIVRERIQLSKLVHLPRHL
jgi:hypothetical protein